MTMKISEIRRLNLNLLIDKYGSQVKFADAVDLAPAYVGQLARPPESKGSRNLGEKTAKKITDKLDFPEGWFDTPHFETGNSDIDSLSLSRDEIDLIANYRTADNIGKQNVSSVAKLEAMRQKT